LHITIIFTLFSSFVDPDPYTDQDQFGTETFSMILVWILIRKKSFWIGGAVALADAAPLEGAAGT
jgi:hypothetical protein